MENNQRQLTKIILNITLEIIFLLTGEEYGPVEKSTDEMPIRNSHISGECSSSPRPIMEPPTRSVIHGRRIEQKILDLTNKITELLTGEVPVRCQDVAVYFSMEELEYIERQKDEYKDIMITSPDLSNATYELGEFYTSDSSPFYPKNEHSFLTTIQEVRCSLVGEQNKTKYWDATTFCEEKYPGSQCCRQIGDIIQGTPVTLGKLFNEHEKGRYRSPIHCNRQVYLDHSYAITLHNKPLLVEQRDFTESGIPVPTNHTIPTDHTSQHLTPQIKEEPNIYDLHAPVVPTQYTTVHIKEETDNMQEYQCAHIKGEPGSCDSLNLTNPDHMQSPFYIKEEPPIYTPICHTPQYPAHQFEAGHPSEIDIYLPTNTEFPNSRKAEIDIYLPTDTPLTNKSKGVHRKHVQQHKLLDKPFLCTECGKRFQCKSGLSTHKKIHMLRKLHTCTECGKSFLSHLYFLRHQKIHSGENPYSCEECGKCFLKASNLTVHQKVHRSKGPFSCDKCGKRFRRISNLNQHQKLHGLEKPFACSECDKWFSSKSELDDHRRIHSGEKTFSCSDCGKSFIKVQNLVNHQRLHTGKNPFSCIECGKRFTSNTYLIRHMDLHTRKKTSYSCLTCGKYFNSNLDLIIHQRIHSGGKSGTSSEWRNCFIRKLGFVIHQSNHAKEKKSFSCPDCKERFVKKIHLIHHRKVHIQEKSIGT